MQKTKYSDIKSRKNGYYCEKRDPDFERKMYDVLVVYEQISVRFAEDGNVIIFDEGTMVHSVSRDEKPDIQTIVTTSDDMVVLCEIMDINGLVHYHYLQV